MQHINLTWDELVRTALELGVKPGAIKAWRRRSVNPAPLNHVFAAVEFLRSASLLRSSPLISAAFSFGRKDSNGTIAAIATSGSFFSVRLS